jgi:hypothetical protein
MESKEKVKVNEQKFININESDSDSNKSSSSIASRTFNRVILMKISGIFLEINNFIDPYINQRSRFCSFKPNELKKGC